MLQKSFLLKGSLTISYSQNIITYVLNTSKVICFLLVTLSILIPVHSQSDPSCDYLSSPEQVNLTQLYCSPSEGEVYNIGDVVNLSWNPSNAFLAGPDGEVEVYLFRRRQNLTGYEESVMLDPGHSLEFILVPLKENSMNITIEEGWLPNYNYSTPSENDKNTFVFRVVPKDSGSQDNRAFSSPYFIVIGQDMVSSQGSATVAVASTYSPYSTTINIVSTVSIISFDSKAQENDKSDNRALIAFISVACVAAFLAFIAIAIAVRSRKRISNQNKQSLSNLSTNSSTPMIENNNRDFESPAEVESIHSTTPLANKEEMRSKSKSTLSLSNENQPISASDAALLSDAFRQVLRKPDWKPEDEEDYDTNLSQEERLRRKEANKLMKKELAEEGTDLQNITRRHTKVEIRNIGDELEKDGASHLSESLSK